jgi:hypothetical protein
MTNIIAIYSIEKTICSWTSDGSGEEHRPLFSESCNPPIPCASLAEALEKIIDKYGFPSNEFEEVNDYTHDHRYTYNQIENNNGDCDINGEWLADYNIFIDLYKHLTPEECQALTQTKPGVE